jgi:hypothetical protein
MSFFDSCQDCGQRISWCGGCRAIDAYGQAYGVGTGAVNAGYGNANNYYGQSKT